MDILKRLINVIALCWLTVTSVFLYVSCKSYLEYARISADAKARYSGTLVPLDDIPDELLVDEDGFPLDGSSSFDISTAKVIEPYSIDFEALALILCFGVAILAINYIFFKKPTLWHKTK